MSNLRKKTIRLAFENPELRPFLLPILKQAEFDAKEIGEDVPGALEGDADESYMKDHFKQDWFHELDDKQESGELENPARIRKVDEDATLPAMESKRAGTVELFAEDFDPKEIGEKKPGPIPELEGEFTQEEWSGMDEALHNATVKLAYENPDLRSHLLPLLKESAAEKGTFKCPSCGSKVLKATKYCLKCQKKVKEAQKKSEPKVAAAPKKVEDLPAKEQKVAKGMFAKGYRYCVQVTAYGKNFGEPLYFKSAGDVGPFLRSFPDAAKAKTAWNFVMEEESDKKATPKVAHKPILTRDGLNKAAVRNGDGAMLYLIDSGKNSSKFYEMLIVPDGKGGFALQRRWGALTDSGTTGRVDKKDMLGLSQNQAQRELQKIYKSKTRKGYVDAFGPAHKSPIDGKKLKMGEYPLGLVREIGFGWGSQSMGQCIPALRDMVEHLDAAIKEIQEQGKSDHIKEDLDDALGTISAVAKEDSSMAGKLRKYISHVIRRVSGSPRFLPDPEGRKLMKDIRTIINYVKKQTAYCS